MAIDCCFVTNAISLFAMSFLLDVRARGDDVVRASANVRTRDSTTVALKGRSRGGSA